MSCIRKLHIQKCWHYYTYTVNYVQCHRMLSVMREFTLHFLSFSVKKKLYYCEPFQITAKELSFWTSDKVELDQLKLEIEKGLYPPRFQIAAGGDATKSVLAKITFKGTTENLNTVLLLKPETSGIILSLLLKSLSIIYRFLGSFIA